MMCIKACVKKWLEIIGISLVDTLDESGNILARTLYLPFNRSIRIPAQAWDDVLVYKGKFAVVNYSLHHPQIKLELYKMTEVNMQKTLLLKEYRHSFTIIDIDLRNGTQNSQARDAFPYADYNTKLIMDLSKKIIPKINEDIVYYTIPENCFIIRKNPLQIIKSMRNFGKLSVGNTSLVFEMGLSKPVQIIFNKIFLFGKKMILTGGTVTYLNKNGEVVSETKQQAKIVVDRYDYTPIELLKFVYNDDSILRKEWENSFGSI